MSIHILHTADVHWHPDRQAEALASLQRLYEHAHATKPDLIVMAGDLFDKGIQASDGGGYPALVGMIQRLLDLAPIVTVYGTVTHDVPGCYEVLAELIAKHSFTILDPAATYYLIDGEAHSFMEELDPEAPKLLIFGCSEPQKSFFLANRPGMGRAEATEAINDGMRLILAGIGARRAELPEVPALMVYHGTVRGATMCNGQVVPGTDIAIGRDDLALTGCTYTALGHIHTAQEIAEGMCYGGSVQPWNWGELDQKSFWDVSLSPGAPAEYYPVNFPHPPRKKIVTDWIKFMDEDADIDVDVSGFRVWQVYRVTPEMADGVDMEVCLSELHARGALPGSRVTTETIPTETVRAGEIQKATTLAQKLGVYAENSGDALADSVIGKAGEMEQAALDEGVAGGGLRIWWHTLMVRGATGIHLGMGLEEVSIDLREYADGLILLAGPNGCGKTTLTELWSPFTELITRGETLQKHFYLKDSHRDLRGTDEVTGDEYRSLVQIDPTLASPKAEYQLYRRAAGSEEWLPLTDGRQDSYKETVERLFGTMDLYVRSAHTPQIPTRSHPSLAEASKGERRELFRELGGLDYLQAYADEAKDRKQAGELTVNVQQAKAEVLDGQVAEIPALDEQLCVQEHARGKHAVVTAELGELGMSLRLDVDSLAEQVKVQDAKRQELMGLDARDDTLIGERDAVELAIEHAKDAAENGPKAAEIVQKHGELSRTRGELIYAQSKHLKDGATTDEAHRLLMEAFQSQSNALQADALVLAQRLGSLAADKAGLVARVDALSATTETPIDETCPTCNQTLPPAARARLRETRVVELSDLAERQNEVLACDNSITDISEQQATAQAKIAELVKPERGKIEPWEGKAALASIETDLVMLDIDSARETVSQAQEAAVRIEEGGHRLHDLNNQLHEVEGRMELIKLGLDDELDQRHHDRSAELEDLRTRYTEAQKQGVELQTEIRGLDEQIEKLKETEETLYQLREAIAELTCESREWAYLQRACGPDGIQALELDAMGPGITEVANRLLGAVGSGEHNHFDRIKIDTTRMGGSGSKARQIEDFLIFCRDTRRPGDMWTELGMISVGESVWIRKAITEAFGSIRKSAGGTQFLLGFLDEADGALDAGIRSHYVNVVEAAHQESGRRQTMLVSHSPEVQQAIPQRIEMAELAE